MNVMERVFGRGIASSWKKWNIFALLGVFLLSTITSLFLASQPVAAADTASLSTRLVVCNGSTTAAQVPANFEINTDYLTSVSLLSDNGAINKTDNSKTRDFYTIDALGNLKFQNLPAGTYSYKVKYENAGNVFNGGGSSISLADGEQKTVGEDGSGASCMKMGSSETNANGDPNNTGATNQNGEQTPTSDGCQFGGLGWVICPAIAVLSRMNDAAYGAVESMLFIDPVTVKNGGPLHQIWSIFRDMANVLFVIAFLVIIYAQATGAGLSAYGIKKLFPRLVLAAIAVNISFFISQALLDLSNVIGASLHDLLMNIVDNNPNAIDISSFNWDTVITGLLAGAGTIGAISVAASGPALAAAIAALLPFLVTALFAVFAALVVLIARQAIIILLVAISPLAMVALVLPNTEKLFERWRSLFTTMLLMYPLVALLFAGSKLAAWILLSAPTDESGVSPFLVIAAIAVMFIPLFGVPFILKFSGNLLGRIGAFVNNPQKGPFDALRRRAEGFAERKKNYATANSLSTPIPDKINKPSSGNESKQDKWKRRRNNARRAYLNSAASYSGRARRTRDAEILNEDAKEVASRATTVYSAERHATDPNFLAKTVGGRAVYHSERAFQGAMDISKNRAEEQLDKIQTEATNAQLSSMIRRGAFSPGTEYAIRDASGRNIHYTNDPTDVRDAIEAAVRHHNVDAKLVVRNAAGKEETFDTRSIYPALLSKTAQMGDVPLADKVMAINPEVKADMKEFISYNLGNFSVKAPDYVKGLAGAFGAPKAEEIAGWHQQTANRARDYAAANENAANEIAKSITQAMNNDQVLASMNRQTIQNLIQDARGQNTNIYNQLDDETRGYVRDFISGKKIQRNNSGGGDQGNNDS